MEIKEIQPVTVFYREEATTMADMWKFVVKTPAEMYGEAVKLGLEITGPQIWVYYGADGQPETKFTLNIALPVKHSNFEQKNNFKQLGLFKCATLIHQGKWENFRHSYEKLIGELMASGLKMTGECREIYYVIDLEQPENNITEIQMGIN